MTNWLPEATPAGPPVNPELLARVRDATELLATSGTAPAPEVGRAAACAALAHAGREALARLAALRAEPDATPGRVHAARSLVHRILDAGAKKPVRLAMHESPFRTEWTDLLLEATIASDYGVGALFFGRARELGDRTLFLLSPGVDPGRISWAEAETQVVAIGRALLAHRASGSFAPVAMLSMNSHHLALFDLACLVTGTPNVPVPANSPSGQIAAIVRHAGARSLFLGDESMAEIALGALSPDARPPHVVWLDPSLAARDDVRAFADFLDAGRRVPAEAVREAALAVRAGDLATVMYTSGSTGEPKGVRFTQANLVTKRFARAAAWPDLGEGDVFLCYLPLFHTFGRWLEMLGCVFWGAVYAFVEDSTIESLLYAFHRVRPTTFISVPKKWIQVAEAAAPLLENDTEEPRDVAAKIKEITGGRLRRGLSAAGYLPPSVFRRFHRAGIELHSGFGMTEATGGITMTPTGDYRADSIGVALPGIELKRAEDGELWIRGPYVTDPSPEDPPRENGWFATGDIVREDNGHLTIVDRKKEIFKNVQGETISPRRIEQLFAEFDVVERVFVMGDRREFCTALLVPAREIRDAHAGEATGSLTIESPELRDLFAPIVATVNRFLAPYERLLDFVILARDLDESELTAKGTARRNLVAERYREAIEPMYSRDQVAVTTGGVIVRIPQWFFRQIGRPSSELHPVEGGLALGASGERLVVAREGEHRVRVGDLVYDSGGKELLIGEIFGRPELWLGNPAARSFAGRGIEHWWKRGRRFRVRTRLAAGAQVIPETRLGSVTPPREEGAEILRLHAAASRLHHPDLEIRRAAVARIGTELGRPRSEMEPIARELLRASLEDRSIRADALAALLPALDPHDLLSILDRHAADPTFLDDDERGIVASQILRTDQLEALAERLATRRDADAPVRERLLQLLVRQSVHHPENHRRVRTLLVDLAEDARETIERDALNALVGTLVRDFRAALPSYVHVSGATWKDVVRFADDVVPHHAARIADAIATTAILAEAQALLAPGSGPVGGMLAAGSVRIGSLARGHGRTIYHVEVVPLSTGRGESSFEFVIKVRDEQTWEHVQEELRLLVIAREGWAGRPVVKSIGGGYREQGVWTEEYLPGHTLDQLVEELSFAPTELSPGVEAPLPARLTEVWPFLVSSCASLLVDFWKRTDQRVAIDAPTAKSFVLPAHDWQVGGRLVSLTGRVPCRRLTQVLESVQRGVVAPLQKLHPIVGTEPEWRFLFAAALEAFGEEEGLAMLEHELRDDLVTLAMEDDNEVDTTRMAPAFYRFASQVRRHGFLPVRIRTAARRYRRWALLNPLATLEAQAATLDQFVDAYGLDEMEAERPGSRLQLYRHTVFRGSDAALTTRLDEISARILQERPAREEWSAWVAALRESFSLSDREEFFLARILYPHLDPKGRAMLVREEDQGGGVATGVQVERRDERGDILRVRRPANPNEIAALYRIFRIEEFRGIPNRGSADHLVATDEEGRVIGGLIYRRMSETYVRLEWIVVSHLRRGRGIGAVLLQEFLERMRATGVRAVSTGFFRPAFFAKFGFGVDPRYAGIVKVFDAPAETPK